MLEPLVSRLVLAGDGHGTALLRSASTTAERTRCGSRHRARAGPTFDGRGRPVASSVTPAGTVT